MKPSTRFTRKLSHMAVVAALTASAGFSPMASAVEEGVCGPMDVVFLIDDSGSMGTVINSIKASFSSFITDVETASAGDYQMALVTQDTAAWNPERPEVDEDLAPANSAAVNIALSGVFAGGGSGTPEPTDAMLDLVINGTTVATAVNEGVYADCNPTGAGFTSANFRIGAEKILILATDAPPGGCDDIDAGAVEDANVVRVATDASAGNIKISAIATGFGFGVPAVENRLMAYAAGSGGIFAASADGDVSAIISEIIASCGSSANECPLSQGYWKNHEEVWPVDSLTVGDAGGTYLDSYTAEQLLEILNTPPKKGNSYLILAHQVIAALLNIENGSDPSVIAAELDAALAALDDVALPGDYIKDESLNDLAAVLDEYNNRILTPDCEESGAEEEVPE